MNGFIKLWLLKYKLLTSLLLFVILPTLRSFTKFTIDTYPPPVKKVDSIIFFILLP